MPNKQAGVKLCLIKGEAQGSIRLEGSGFNKGGGLKVQQGGRAKGSIK